MACGVCFLGGPCAYPPSFPPPPPPPLLCQDFRSIELRLIAHLSGDQRLIAMLASDGRGTTDVFTLLTSEWYAPPMPCGLSGRGRVM